MATIVIRDTDVTVVDILQQMARGLTYKQILEMYPMLTYPDLLTSAGVAAEVIGSMVRIKNNHTISAAMTFTVKDNHFRSFDEIRQEIPRAFVKWTDEETQRMVIMFKANRPINEIAESLQRSRGSINARLEKLGLVEAK